MYNQVSEVTSRQDFTLLNPTSPPISSLYFFTSTYSFSIMPNIGKTARREHSDREVAVILVLHAKGYSAREISAENDVPKSTINAIIRRATTSPDG
jgi:DNA-binding NarL/FixJ family response regulator